MDREPRHEIRTRRNAEAADTQRIAIASELDYTRINREYFELEGWKGSHVEYKSAHTGNKNPRENSITRKINIEATRDRESKIQVSCRVIINEKKYINIINVLSKKDIINY